MTNIANKAKKLLVLPVELAAAMLGNNYTFEDRSREPERDVKTGVITYHRVGWLEVASVAKRQSDNANQLAGSEGTLAKHLHSCFTQASQDAGLHNVDHLIVMECAFQAFQTAALRGLHPNVPDAKLPKPSSLRSVKGFSQFGNAWSRYKRAAEVGLIPGAVLWSSDGKKAHAHKSVLKGMKKASA